MSVERAGRQMTSTIPSTRDTILVSHYGVHWTADGIAFLEQGGPRGGSNAIGLALKSPFRVRLEGKTRSCNHNIPLAAPTLNPVHVEAFKRIRHDPLVGAMFPVPKEQGTSGVWYVNDQNDKLGLFLALLSRMSSPVHGIIQPIWLAKTPAAVIEELKVTNVQPLVLTDVQPKDTAVVEMFAKAAMFLPRRLVLAGRAEVALPSSVIRIASSRIPELDLKDLMTLPWETFGATMIRKYMRNENDPVAAGTD
jgi:hypothetical protein